MNYEAVIKIVTFALLVSGLFYAGYANELLKVTISPVDRGIIIIGFIYGIYKMASEIPMFIYTRLIRYSNRSKRS